MKSSPHLKFPQQYDFQEAPPTGGMCEVGEKIVRELEMKNRYFHQVTQAQADSTSNVTIGLPERIYDTALLKVQGKHGLMIYGTHYVIENAGKDLIILVENVELNKDDMIELFVYDVPFKDSAPISILWRRLLGEPAKLECPVPIISIIPKSKSFLNVN